MIDGGAEIDAALLKSINTRQWSADIERQLIENQRLLHGCAQSVTREAQATRAWFELPWYVRFWRSRAVRIQAFRMRLGIRIGEFIAGQTFED